MENIVEDPKRSELSIIEINLDDRPALATRFSGNKANAEEIIAWAGDRVSIQEIDHEKCVGFSPNDCFLYVKGMPHVAVQGEFIAKTKDGKRVAVLRGNFFESK